MIIGVDRPVNLGLDVLNLDNGETFELTQFGLIVKAPNASDNGITLHHLHGFHNDDLEVAGCRNKDVNLADSLHRRPTASMMMP